MGQIKMVTPEELLEIARVAIDNSYSPYSKFRVAAVLETGGGSIFTGVNIESASYRLTMCAEQAAVAAAVTAGARDLAQILIYAPDAEVITPCGACLQTLAEFSKDLLIFLVAGDGHIKISSLKELMPSIFNISLRPQE